MRMRLWLLGLGTAALIGGASFGTYRFLAEAPQGVLLSHLEELKKGSITKAYYLYTSEDFQKRQPLAEFRDWIAAYPAFSEHENAEVLQSSAVNGRAIVRLEGKEDQETPVVYLFKYENGSWKIDEITPVASTVDPRVQQEERAKTLLQEHLSELKSGNVKSAWAKHLSKSFKKTLGAKEYKAILADYPVLTTWTEIAFLDSDDEEGFQKLELELTNGRQKNHLDVWVKDDEGALKLWAFEVEPTEDEPFPPPEPELQETPPEITALLTLAAEVPFELPQPGPGDEAPPAPAPPPTPEPVALVIEEPVKEPLKEIDEKLNSFLKSVQQNDLEGAYQATAPDFKNATSFEDFKSYFDKDQIFKSFESVTIDENQFQGKEAFIKATLLTREGKKISLDARFILDDKEWKLLGIRFEMEDAPLTIESVKIGTELSLDGQVLNPRSTFHPEDRKLLARVLIEGGNKGESASFVLEHLPSHSKIEPITLVFKQDGTQVIDVTFTSPSTGWPVGDYEMRTETSQGASNTVRFKVEKSHLPH